MPRIVVGVDVRAAVEQDLQQMGPFARLGTDDFMKRRPPRGRPRMDVGSGPEEDVHPVGVGVPHRATGGPDLVMQRGLAVRRVLPADEFLDRQLPLHVADRDGDLVPDPVPRRIGQPGHRADDRSERHPRLQT